MNPILLLIALSASAAEVPDEDTIVVTASREPQAQEETAASTTVIDRETIEALNLPLTSDLLRLVPGTAVAVSGPAGSQTQIRIRGAEANHSLLFIDGIRFNDPAAGNEPRFELLSNDTLSTIEVVRGPQSALWGAEAVGGVVSLQTADPRDGNRMSANAEYGSHDSFRSSGQFSRDFGSVGIAGSAGWLRSDGIDAFGAQDEFDGFENVSASLKAVYRPSGSSELGLVGHLIDAKNEYDDVDPVTFFRADTGHSTRNRMYALRGWGKAAWGGEQPWIGRIEASFLKSSNRNALDGEPLNSTFGRRTTFGGQLSKLFNLGGGEHRLTAAIDHQRERFRARDQQFFGATNQNRSRSMTGFIGEWRAEWSPLVTTDVAFRHDRFSAIPDTTTFQASVLVSPLEGWSAHVGYGEGVAQPTFYDLFGFFPNSFVGNPDLMPEHSRTWEAGIRWTDDRTKVSGTGYISRLRNEIVDVFDLATFLASTVNVDGTSRRKGVEFTAEHRFGTHTLISVNYSWLDADEQRVAGSAPLKEVRRPRHSANLFATTRLGPVQAGATLAYVGQRTDTDFEAFPSRIVKLHDYVLASLDLAWRVIEPVNAYLRLENAFDADYQDALRYNTAGRTIYAGLRLRLGD